MNKVQENERRMTRLAVLIHDASAEVLTLRGDVPPTLKRRRTMKVTAMMRDSRELWLRNAGLWQKGVRK